MSFRKNLMLKYSIVLLTALSSISFSALAVNQQASISGAWVPVGNANFSLPTGSTGVLAFSSTGVASYGGSSISSAGVMQTQGGAWSMLKGYLSYTPTGMAFAPGATYPFIVVNDNDGYNAHVYKYNASNKSWVPLGGPAALAGYFAGSIAVGPHGSPYILVSNSSLALSVLKFKNNQWVIVGNANFSNNGLPAANGNQFLAIASDGAMYVATGEGNNGVNILTLVANKWTSIGSINTNGLSNVYCAIAVDPANNTPYVYAEVLNKRIWGNVYRYNSAAENWVRVGTPLWVSARARIVFSPSGDLYSVYAINGNITTLQIVKLNSRKNEWISVGDTLSDSANDGTEPVTAFSFDAAYNSPVIAVASTLKGVTTTTVKRFVEVAHKSQ